MYYFDAKYLRSYMESGADLKVYIDQDWLDIPDTSDIAGDVKGFGYDEHGKKRTFAFKAIEQIMADGYIFTMEDLQKVKSGEPAEEDPEASKKGEEVPEKPAGPSEFEDAKMPDAPADMPAGVGGDEKENEKKPKPQEDVYRVGKNLIRDLFKAKKQQVSEQYKGKVVKNVDKNCSFYNTSGEVVKVEEVAGKKYVLYRVQSPPSGDLVRKELKNVVVL